MVPVPTTLQTFVIVLIGLCAGPVSGGGAAALYLVMVLADLPVLSSAQQRGGLAFFEFVAAGYVVGFVPAGFIAGWFGRGSGWRGGSLWARRPRGGSGCGVPVMASHLGLGLAIEKGLTPFLVGAIAKSALAAWGAHWLVTSGRRGDAASDWRPRYRVHVGHDRW